MMMRVSVCSFLLPPCFFISIYVFHSSSADTPPQFLTAADFRAAALEDQEPASFLTDSDFNNAQKYKDLLEVKARRRSSILTQQRFYRGDIRGKAALRRERHRRLQQMRRLNMSAALYNDNYYNNFVANSGFSRRRYNGVASVVKKWPNGRIPYVLSATDYSERERAVLAKAFQEYHSRTCIRFVPKTPFDHDFLYIGKIDGCFSDVGRAGGKQELSLDDGCLHVDTVIHELMHSVGFYHEHERWDRDQFLVILWQNIDRDAYDQFGRVDLLESSYYDQGYDYRSIMHYDSLAFSRNGRETLLAREPLMTTVIGSATDFSAIDLAKIHKMYQCFVVVDAGSEPVLPPPNPIVGVQSLEFTGDNSILGVGAISGNSPEAVINGGTVAAAPIPRPGPPPIFRLMPPPLTARSLPLARPQLQRFAAQNHPPMMAVAAGTKTRKVLNGNNGTGQPLAPLYLRVNNNNGNNPNHWAKAAEEEGQIVGKKEEDNNEDRSENKKANKANDNNDRQRQQQQKKQQQFARENDARGELQRAPCQDQLANNLCPLWLPYCHFNFYSQLMRQFCARSCGFCEEEKMDEEKSVEENLETRNWPTIAATGRSQRMPMLPMPTTTNIFPVIVNAQQKKKRRRK